MITLWITLSRWTLAAALLAYSSSTMALSLAACRIFRPRAASISTSLASSWTLRSSTILSSLAATYSASRASWRRSSCCRAASKFCHARGPSVLPAPRLGIWHQPSRQWLRNGESSIEEIAIYPLPLPISGSTPPVTAGKAICNQLQVPCHRCTAVKCYSEAVTLQNQ